VKLIVGIDPGVSGGLCVLRDGQLHYLGDLPVMSVGSTKQIIPGELAEFFKGWVTPPEAVVVEDNRANGANGSLANYSMGLSMGVILGVLGALSLPLVRVKPNDWKKVVGLGVVKGTATQRKEASRQRALEIWAGDTRLIRKMDHNRADAALIAEAYRRGM
jgi:crossover junction endodeoxyribonuclease RuvC